jgi:hypothetical protein
MNILGFVICTECLIDWFMYLLACKNCGTVREEPLRTVEWLQKRNVEERPAAMFHLSGDAVCLIQEFKTLIFRWVASLHRTIQNAKIAWAASKNRIIDHISETRSHGAQPSWENLRLERLLAFFGSRRLIVVFVRARHWSVSLNQLGEVSVSRF